MNPKYVIIVRERYETYGLKAWQFLKEGKSIWYTEDVDTAKQKYLETLKCYPYDCVKIMHDLTPIIDADFHGCQPSDKDYEYDPMIEQLNLLKAEPVYIDEMLLLEGWEPYEVDIEEDSSYDPAQQQAILGSGSYNQDQVQSSSIVPVDVDIED